MAKLYGRITLFGEYLADHTGILSVPSIPFYLSDFPLEHELCSYRPELDLVALELSKAGKTYIDRIYGNLPLGYGFASSTVLCLLHSAFHQRTVELMNTVTEVDNTIHGFQPSGLDTFACMKQETGIFMTKNTWIPLDSFQMPKYKIFLPVKEQHRCLPDVQKNILERKKFILPLIENMLSQVMKKGTLNKDTFSKYCRELLMANVYSNLVNSFICDCLNEGLCAKSLGGLYDKAVLVFWPNKIILSKIIKSTPNYQKHLYPLT